ncbi:site-specific integrase [Bdellovibrio sp. NC01]|uniref:tyrosine-type recombinase/integrase n=1 Tax=Bdellovibrio sp. NC01 TaxID=2220073 RepID=UPI00115B79DD|nr:site-specific integrase [Bdellovibrio sp. NC01]QDK37905.1 hypothetical protein DOE51_10080 [Bdellovibrio sp. NC01]
MSVKKVTTSSGEVRWEVRARESGRGSRRVKRRFEKKIDAEKFLLDFGKRKETLVIDPFAAVTFENKYFLEEAQYWLTSNKERFSPGHYNKAKAFISEFHINYGNLQIKKFTPQFLTKFQMDTVGRGSSVATCNRKTEILVAILNYSVKQRRIPSNPSVGFKKFSKQSVEMKFWSEDEARQFLLHINLKYQRHSKDRWIYLVYLIALNTGMRAGEIWGLKRSDINQTRGTISVWRQFNRVSLKLTHTKGKNARVVPANDYLLQELRVWCMDRALGMDDLLFSTETGKAICHENFVARRFNQDLMTWGGRRIRFHDLRHTAITFMVSKKIDLKTVKDVAGHASITTTMEYSHMLSEAVSKVAAEISLVPAEQSNRLRLLKEEEENSNDIFREIRKV